MRATIFVAEHVTHHQDGSFTVVRGGIDQFSGEPGEPIPVQGSLMIMIDASRHEVGQHDFKISIVSMDGNKVADDIEGEFSIQEGGGKTQFSIDFRFQVEDPGTYEFGLNIDGREESRWSIHATEVTSERERP